jgi:hypothetical protein
MAATASGEAVLVLRAARHAISPAALVPVRSLVLLPLLLT